MSNTLWDEPGWSGCEAAGAPPIAEPPGAPCAASGREVGVTARRDDEASGSAVGEIVWGESERMCALRDRVERGAASDAAVLLTGETGTG